MLNLNLEYIHPFIEKEKILSLEQEILGHQEKLMSRTGAGNDFLGWLDLPGSHSHAFIDGLISLGSEMRETVDALVVVGIGGSYLGARALFEALHDPFGLYRDRSPEILYAGHHLSGDYLQDLLHYLEDRSYAIIVISKSGTTTEPAVAFRLLKEQMVRKWGSGGASERIVAITDGEKGALRQMADEEGYRSYTIPGDVGGRYSVLTPVGLVPLAMGGIDIRALLGGARQMMKDSENLPFAENPVLLYATARNILYKMGKHLELLVSYHPRLHYFSEWWKQLFGESEGKDQRGIYPASVDFTTDLHSLGQYIQDGERIMFETVISIQEEGRGLVIPDDRHDLDGMNYMAGKEVRMVNQKARLATILAHVDGGVPNLVIEIDKLNENTLGEMIYFFEKACAISGYILGVNPFDQPGVEAYKNNMFALLGRQGFEKEAAAIQKRLPESLA
jgi:glucose-6-phosphate isomerase